MPDSASQDAKPFPQTITLADLNDVVGSGGGNARVIDLRDRADFERAHIPGSSRIALHEIGSLYLLPPRRRSLVLVAEDPASALLAAERLRSSGYDVRTLIDPMSRWSGEWEAGPERIPAWEPSPLVMEWGGELGGGEPRGSRHAVDLGCGSGRDAVHLAQRGFRVTAIDILPDAIDQGCRLAARHGVSVSFLHADIARDPERWRGPWDLINVQKLLDRRILPMLGSRLREEGLLLYETFLEGQEAQGRTPRKRASLLGSGELRESALAQGLRILHYREGPNCDGDWTASLAARADRPRGGAPPEPSEERGGEDSDRAQE